MALSNFAFQIYIAAKIHVNLKIIFCELSVKRGNRNGRYSQNLKKRKHYSTAVVINHPNKFGDFLLIIFMECTEYLFSSCNRAAALL